MNEKKQIGLDFVVDKLTNSIENVVTGDSFSTDITLISNSDIKNLSKGSYVVKIEFLNYLISKKIIVK